MQEMVRLSVSGIWSDLPEYIATELVKGATQHLLKEGNTLFQAGARGDGCYRVDKGMLKVILESPEGGERIVAVLSEGSIVGDLAMLDGLPRSASVIALADCELRFISRESFQRSAERHPKIHEFLVQMLARRLREADETIAALAFLTAKGRVANVLLELASAVGQKQRSGGVAIPNKINQRELAAMAGVARENTNRILRSLQQKKVIVRYDKSYRIDDIEKLKAEIEWER